jgi:hypothetical protein
MGSIQGKTVRVGRAGVQELASGHLQSVMDIVCLTCSCINRDHNVDKGQARKKKESSIRSLA